MDIAYVANGAYDAYIDIGDVLTAEIIPCTTKYRTWKQEVL